MISTSIRSQSPIAIAFLWAAIFLLLLLGSHGSSASSSSSSSNPKAAGASSHQEVMARYGLLEALKPNPYVAASPLIVAAVCSDGMVMMAAHTVSKEEKLLRALDSHNNHRDGVELGKNATTNTTTMKTFAERWNDFDTAMAGPSRICRIDRFGTHLLSAGWRADCDLLTDKIRSIASKEVALFGRPKWGLPYGRYLAEEATYFLCQCGVSEATRLPSCVGLLAACGDLDDNTSNNNVESDLVGSLWMIDVNGWYSCRSLAIGGGPAPENDQNCTVVAQLVNSKLAEFDSREMSTDEVVSRILTILSGENDGADGDNHGDPLVPEDCELELAITKPSGQGGKVYRPTLSSLSIMARKKKS